MLEIRIHGRGGDDPLPAAELLSVAAFDDGYHAQAFPSFGSERTGAPVVAFCRIDSRRIRTREPISEPDALIIVDPTLLHQVDVFAGAQPTADVLVNTSHDLDELGISAAAISERRQVGRVLAVPATELARLHLGRPLPTAALLGGFAALTSAVSLASVVRAIRERFTGTVADGNAAAAEAAYEAVVGAATHA